MGGAGGPRERVVGRVGGVCEVLYRHITVTEPEEGECRGVFDGRTRCERGTLHDDRTRDKKGELFLGSDLSR